MHNFFLHKNILIFRRFFNSANRFMVKYSLNIYLISKKVLSFLYKTKMISLAQGN